jgi:hypothetical protein
MKDQMHRFTTLLIPENACKLEAKYTNLKERALQYYVGKCPTQSSSDR